MVINGTRVKESRSVNSVIAPIHRRMLVFILQQSGADELLDLGAY